MDFTFTEEQQEAAGLARQICGDLAGDPDRMLKALQDAGLADIGAELGATGVCLVLTEVGRTATDLPLEEFLGGHAEWLGLARCAQAQGLAEGALDLTASYAKERQQFERPIGSFQAVAHRLADGYIATRLSWLMLWRAAWLVDEGEAAEVELAGARLWATDTLHAIGHTCVHVHGGVGIDLDGVAHRYYSETQRLIREIGSATLAAREVGLALATGS